MSGIFRVTGTDRRQEYIDKFDDNLPFVTQRPSGKDVEYFGPDVGFVLLQEQKDINKKLPRTHKVRSVAELSLGAELELREFYYALRGNPDLVGPFAGAKDIYAGVLGAINTMEIFCDVNRSKFTVGNLPKGFIHYGHSWSGYGDQEKPIGFTENIARQVLNEHEIRHAQNMIHMEKAAAATRLVSMGFSKLTNSVISTTGGNFTRAIYALANRFHNKKHMTFFVDGDAFGNDMLRALEYGTMNSRHLTPDQAFPSKTHAGIHIAGLFPSVAEKLEIPNDVEQKRPMSNPHVLKRIDFLRRYDLVDDKDMTTWERNMTFELEALSTQYISTIPDEKGKYPPVGLGIYLAEYMRLNNIPCKPQPIDDDERLHDHFKQAALSGLRGGIRQKIESESPIEDLKAIIEEKISEITSNMVKEIFDSYKEELENKIDEEITADNIRDQIAKQYQDDPEREIFSINEIADQLIERVEVDVEWNAEELQKQITSAVDKYVEGQEELYNEEIEFQDLEDVGELKDFYDVVEEAIGADPEDCERVREALEWRLS